MIDSLTVLKNTLADAIQPVVTKRFHTDIAVGQQPFAGEISSSLNSAPQDELRFYIGAGQYQGISTNQGPFKAGFNSKVLQAVNDIDFAIGVAKEFQDLFTFEQRPDNATQVLASTFRNPDIVNAIPEQVDQFGYPLLFTGRQGVTAGDVLRGASIVGQSVAGTQYLGQSTLYAFANAMSTVNQRIKDLGSYAAAQLPGDAIDQELGTTPVTVDQVSYRTPLNKTGESILQPEVEGSVVSSVTGQIYPENQRNLRLNLQPTVSNDLSVAFAATSGGTTTRNNVEALLDGLLDPESTNFSPNLLQFIVNNYVQYGFMGFPEGRKSDIDNDGAVTSADLLGFLANFGRVLTDEPSPGDINVAAAGGGLSNVLNELNDYSSFSDFQFAPTNGISSFVDVAALLNNLFTSTDGGGPVVPTGIGGDETTVVSFNDDNQIEFDADDGGDDIFDPNDFIRD